jgi:hypothetical protein
MSSVRNRIFISYRKSDAERAATHLTRELRRIFEPNPVYFAPDEMNPGDDFPKRLEAALERSAVIIVVIGPKWFDTLGEWNMRPFESPSSWVRKEVAYGLAHEDEVEVVPFLLEDAKFPTVEQAGAALPLDMQSIARRQAVRESRAGEIPNNLISSVRQALNKPTRVNGGRQYPTILVLHGYWGAGSKGLSTEEIAASQKRYGHEQNLLELLDLHLPGNVLQRGPSGKSATVESEFLTCQAAVLLVDNASLHSEFFIERAKVLAWRRELGMPLVSILIHGLRRQDLAASPVAFLADYFVTVDASSNGTSIKPETVIKAVQERLAKDLIPRDHFRYSDPATQWATDVADMLSNVSPSRLLALGEKLQISPDLLTETDNPRPAIAAALLTTESLDNASKFLPQAIQTLTRVGAHPETKKELVDSVNPLWVDLEAGREILKAARASIPNRLCELRVPRLEWGKYATARASAGATEYPVVSLPSVAGEHAEEELAVRHDRTIRDVLKFNVDDGPEFVQDDLNRLNRAVFANLECKGLSYKQLSQHLRTLRKRFPGVTFLLVSDRGKRSWKFKPPPIIAIDSLDENARRRIELFIRRNNALIEGERRTNAE